MKSQNDPTQSLRQPVMGMTVFRIFLFAAFGLVLLMLESSAALAQTNNANPNVATTPDQAQQTPTGKFIQDLGNQAINVIADKSLTPEQHTSKYHGLLHGAFDMQTIGHFVLGHAWNTASPEQQREYMKLFEAIVVKIYGDRLSFYSGEKFQVKSVRSEDDKDTIVSSEVLHPSGAPPTPVDWRVRQENGKLAIVDVIVEGVSQSVTQRQEYASILQRNNGDINALLNLMRQNLQQSEDNQTGSNTHK